MKNYWMMAKQEVKNTASLTGAAMLTALNVILDFFRIVVSNILEISFSFLAIATAGMLYGPVIGGIVGGLGDLLEYAIRPSGAFFPGFTLNKVVSGVIFGLFLYKKSFSWSRLAIAVLVEMLIVNVVLTPIWLNLMYGSELFAVVRIAKSALLYPINVLLLGVVCKTAKNFRLKIV